MDIRVIFLLLLEGLLALLFLWFSDSISSVRSLLRCTLLVALSLFIRLCFFDRENTDYQWFLKVWVDYYRTSGGFAALGNAIGNYNIPYLYFLALFSYSSIRDLYLIKLLSVLFDIVLSCAGLILVRKCTGNRIQALCCFFVLLYLPTVLSNSSVWGQCDSIYVSLALLGLAAAMPDAEGSGGHPLLSVILMTIAFGFKLQTVFLMPLWLILWIWRKYRWTWFLVFPACYTILILPSVIAGRPFSDAVLLYVNQTGSIGNALNYNAPSLTALFRFTGNTEAMSGMLILISFFAMALILLKGFLDRKTMTNTRFLSYCTLMALTVPFFLPHMHDRYFYAADCLTVILAFCCWQMFPAAVSTQFASFLCYIAYFTGYYQRLGHSNVFLTNDKGAAAVLLSMLWISICLFLPVRRKFFLTNELNLL